MSPGPLRYTSVSRCPSTAYGTSSGVRPPVRAAASEKGVPSSRPSSDSRARRLAAITRRSWSRTITISRLSSTRWCARAASSWSCAGPSATGGRRPSLTGLSYAAVPQVLIVEDDDVIAEGMARHLAAADFEPIVVGKGEQGLARLRFERPDVCVLDLMLPGRDGWNVIETARAEGIGTPIIVVSARGTEHDRVHALEIGADDYLVKPFSMAELVARVKAAARRGTRAERIERGEPIDVEELHINPREVQAYVGGENVGLTPTEFRLLYVLALDRGRVVTRDELLQRIWGRREGHRDRTVDVFVRKLRDKVDRRAPRHTFIQTRYGVGYSLDPVPKS